MSRLYCSVLSACVARISGSKKGGPRIKRNINLCTKRAYDAPLSRTTSAWLSSRHAALTSAKMLPFPKHYYRFFTRRSATERVISGDWREDGAASVPAGTRHPATGFHPAAQFQTGPGEVGLHWVRSEQSLPSKNAISCVRGKIKKRGGGE